MTTGGDATNDPSRLATINLTTGFLSSSVPITLNGNAVDGVFGLAVQSGVLYGFTSNTPTTVISIDINTGVATFISDYGDSSFVFDGNTNDETPEPGTMGAMALGLAGLGGLAYKRRKG